MRAGGRDVICNLFQKSSLTGTECLEGTAGHRWRIAAKCMREKQIGKQIENLIAVPLQARNEEQLKHSCR